MIKKFATLFLVSAIIVLLPMLSSVVDGPEYWRSPVRSEQTLRVAESALSMFANDHGRLPTQEEGLGILTGSYLREDLKDQWDSPLVYHVLNVAQLEYDIHSIGPNRIDENGVGDDVVIGKKIYKCEFYDTCRSMGDYVSIATTCVMFISLLALLFLLSRAAWRRAMASIRTK